MGKHISSIEYTETLTLSKCTDGYWLYDETRGMNLAMRALSPESAFIDALSYYQNRLKEVEGKYKALHEKVDLFVSQFAEDEDY